MSTYKFGIQYAQSSVTFNWEFFPKIRLMAVLERNGGLNMIYCNVPN